jgi:hypothetical protein
MAQLACAAQKSPFTLEVDRYDGQIGNQPFNLYIFALLPERSGRNRWAQDNGGDELGTDR